MLQLPDLPVDKISAYDSSENLKKEKKENNNKKELSLTARQMLLILKIYSWPRGYKTFFILNSVEHEISNAHKYKNIKKFSFFQAQISGEGYFSCS